LTEDLKVVVTEDVEVLPESEKPEGGEAVEQEPTKEPV